GLALDKVEAQVKEVRHALGLAAVEINLFHVGKLVIETLAQSGHMSAVFVHFLPGNGKSFTHANNLVRSQSARAHATLVTTAVHLGFQTYTRFTTHIQSTNTFR